MERRSRSAPWGPDPWSSWSTERCPRHPTPGVSPMPLPTRGSPAWSTTGGLVARVATPARMFPSARSRISRRSSTLPGAPPRCSGTRQVRWWPGSPRRVGCRSSISSCPNHPSDSGRTSPIPHYPNGYSNSSTTVTAVKPSRRSNSRAWGCRRRSSSRFDPARCSTASSPSRNRSSTTPPSRGPVRPDCGDACCADTDDGPAGSGDVPTAGGCGTTCRR